MQQEKQIPWYIYLLAIFPPLMGAGNIAIAKAMAADIPPIGLAFWRWAIAAIVMFPFAYKTLKRDWQIIKENWKIIILIAIPGYMAFSCLIYIASKSTESINVSILSNLFPIFIIVMSYFLYDERLGKSKILGILLAFFGTIYVITDGSLARVTTLSFGKGDLIAIAGALSWAVNSIFLRHKPKYLHQKSLIFCFFMVGFISLAPLYYLETMLGNPMPFTKNSVYAILFVAIPVSVIGMTVWNYTVYTLGAATSGLFFYTMPIFSVVIGTTLLGETLTVYHLIGFALIVIGINMPIITKFYKRKIAKTN